MNGITNTSEMMLKELAVKNKLYCQTWLLIAKLLQNDREIEHAIYQPKIY